MSICAPCQVPHTAEDCEDTLTGRAGLARACFLSAQALQRGRTQAICGQRGHRDRNATYRRPARTPRRAGEW